MRLGLVSLGCDKNTVDSERMLATLTGYGAETVSVREAEVILVNTCGFIDAAKEESIETLISAGRRKQDGRCRAVVAVGCMVERYRNELEGALPEVDVFLGLKDLDRLVPELQTRGFLPEGEARMHPGERLALGAKHVRYLKVSEGCNHGCAFCAIPSWRGRHRSFEMSRLVAEAQRLEEQGVVELNLVAQDLAHWGREFRDGSDIATLMDTLLRETSIPWFRLLYIYSAGLREPLVDLMATEARLLPYIDMPIQHASDTVLSRMRRPERTRSLRRKISWLRDSIPDLTLRTTVLVGFPGETDEEFRELVEFVDEAEFDRLGAFAFSPQEGTRAAAMEGQFVEESVATARLEEVLAVQAAVSAEKLEHEVGQERIAIVDGAVDADDPVVGVLFDDPPREPLYKGRLDSQADDVDGVTVLHGTETLPAGTLVKVQVDHASDFDLSATVKGVERPVRAPRQIPGGRAGDAPASARRSMPVLGMESAWGR